MHETIPPTVLPAEPSLLKAISKGSGKQVKNLILQDEKSSTATLKARGYTPLHIAIMKEDWDEISECLSSPKSEKALITAVEGLTPFHLAVYLGNPETVQYFLEHVPFANSEQYETAVSVAKEAKHSAVTSYLQLYWSIAQNDLLAVQQWLQATKTQRPLEKALTLAIKIRPGLSKLTKYLIDQKVIIEQKSAQSEQKDPLMSSTSAQSQSAPLELILFPDDNAPLTALRIAVNANNVAVVQYLIEELKINPNNWPQNNPQYPDFLPSAIQKNHVEMVDYLAKTGTINLTTLRSWRSGNGDGFLLVNAFHVSIIYGNLKCAQLLLEINSDLINTDAHKQEKGVIKDGYSPLGLAIFYGHRDIVTFIMSVTPRSKKEDKEIQKILPIAIARGNTEVIKYLVEEQKTYRKAHPFSTAFQRKTLSFEYSQNLKKNKNSPLEVAAKNGYTDLFIYLLEEELGNADGNSYQLAVKTAFDKNQRDIILYLCGTYELRLIAGCSISLVLNQQPGYGYFRLDDYLTPLVNSCLFFRKAMRDDVASLTGFSLEIGGIVMDYLLEEQITTTAEEGDSFEKIVGMFKGKKDHTIIEYLKSNSSKYSEGHPLHYPFKKTLQEVINLIKKYNPYLEIRKHVLLPLHSYLFQCNVWPIPNGILKRYSLLEEFSTLSLVKIRARCLEEHAFWTKRTPQDRALLEALHEVIHRINSRFPPGPEISVLPDSAIITTEHEGTAIQAEQKHTPIPESPPILVATKILSPEPDATSEERQAGPSKDPSDPFLLSPATSADGLLHQRPLNFSATTSLPATTPAAASIKKPEPKSELAKKSHQKQSFYTTFQFSLFENVIDNKNERQKRCLTAKAKRALAPSGIMAVGMPVVFAIACLGEHLVNNPNSQLFTSMATTPPTSLSAETFFDSAVTLYLVGVTVALLAGFALEAIRNKLTEVYCNADPEDTVTPANTNLAAHGPHPG